MKHLILPALLVLAPAAVAQSWPPGTLIAALSGDWTGDELPDLAVLIAGSDDDMVADLILYHGTGRGLEPVLSLPGVAFFGDMWGQTPGLMARTPTSFVLTSEQTAIGRTPWTQEVTLAFRGDEWVVAGFTHAFYDRIDPDNSGRCDVNLLNGGWEVVLGDDVGARILTGRDGPRAFPVAQLDSDFMPAPCARIFR